MTKVPFTPAGVSAKATEIYALSDADRTSQINLVRTSFRTWVTDNFNLDATQATWLVNMPPDFQHQLAEELASSLEVKLPITLTTDPVGTGSKLFKIKKCVEISLKNDLWEVNDGGFGIYVSYE